MTEATSEPTQDLRVLFIDDDEETRQLVREGLRSRGYSIDVGANVSEAVELLAQHSYTVLVSDLQLGEGRSGIDLAEHAALHHPEVAVIIVTGHGTVDSAVDALRARADNFISKPVHLDELARAIESAASHQRVARTLVKLAKPEPEPENTVAFIGSSPPVTRLRRFVSRVAPADTSAFIHGESGTGKELVARMLHTHSKRASGPFVAINCAAIPAGLLESELFGHVRGAFTGASGERKGLFMDANHGTLLLDEVGDLPLELQPKLLRALEEREVRPVGGSRTHSFDARLVTSTHRDLRQLVDEGAFREDLYYRINVVTIKVPPLRERGDDVLELAHHFTRHFAKKHDKRVTGVSPEAGVHLIRYTWPGNVRELENAIEQAVTLTRFESIAEGDLPARVRSRRRLSGIETKQGVPTLEQLEYEHIEDVLTRTRGNKSQAARLLGIDRRTLHRKLARLAEDAESLA
ncbi:MAG: sigma-54 dependent transcriptional regulator [Polyangiales bacterium]